MTGYSEVFNLLSKPHNYTSGLIRSCFQYAASVIQCQSISYCSVILGCHYYL